MQLYEVLRYWWHLFEPICTTFNPFLEKGYWTVYAKKSNGALHQTQKQKLNVWFTAKIWKTILCPRKYEWIRELRRQVLETNWVAYKWCNQHCGLNIGKFVSSWFDCFLFSSIKSQRKIGTFWLLSSMISIYKLKMWQEAVKMVHVFSVWIAWNCGWKPKHLHIIIIMVRIKCDAKFTARFKIKDQLTEIYSFLYVCSHATNEISNAVNTQWVLLTFVYSHWKIIHKYRRNGRLDHIMQL